MEAESAQPDSVSELCGRLERIVHLYYFALWCNAVHVKGSRANLIHNEVDAGDFDLLDVDLFDLDERRLCPEEFDEAPINWAHYVQNIHWVRGQKCGMCSWVSDLPSGADIEAVEFSDVREALNDLLPRIVEAMREDSDRLLMLVPDDAPGIEGLLFQGLESGNDFDIHWAACKKAGNDADVLLDRIRKRRGEVEASIARLAALATRDEAFHWQPFALDAKSKKEAENARKRVLELVSALPKGKCKKDFMLVGESDSVLGVWPLIERAAKSDKAVLLLGETGTGKEVVAKLIHFASKRRANRLVEVNCSTLVSEVVDSQLFGYAKGSHSTADEDRKGFFALAHNGTLFLDEIGALPEKAQPMLLRAMEGDKVRPVLSEDDKDASVRIIAATNTDLAKMVDDGTFRADLFYRLNAIRVCLPPLRERGDDALLLARHFADLHDRNVPEEELKKIVQPLKESGFRGNVRELKHAVEVAALEFPKKRRVGKPTPDEIEALMRENGGKIACAAKEYGAPYSTFNDWVKQAGIDHKQIKAECKEQAQAARPRPCR